MKIVVPMIFLAVGFGLFVRQMTLKAWWLLLAGVTLIVLYNYFSK